MTKEKEPMTNDDILKELFPYSQYVFSKLNVCKAMEQARAAERQSMQQERNKPIPADIDTVGNCANCGVEYHIHKEAIPIPKCLDECRLTEDEKNEICDRPNMTDAGFEKACEDKILEKVSRLLQSVEMPSRGDLAQIIQSSGEWDGPNDGYWMIDYDMAAHKINEKLSIALLAQQEKHAEEMTDLDSKLYTLTQQLEAAIADYNETCERVNNLETQWQEKHRKEMEDAFNRLGKTEYEMGFDGRWSLKNSIDGNSKSTKEMVDTCLSQFLEETQTKPS